MLGPTLYLHSSEYLNHTNNRASVTIVKNLRLMNAATATVLSILHLSHMTGHLKLELENMAGHLKMELYKILKVLIFFKGKCFVRNNFSLHGIHSFIIRTIL